MKKNSSQGSVRNQNLKRIVLNPRERQEIAEPKPKTQSSDPQPSALPRPPPQLLWRIPPGWKAPTLSLLCAGSQAPGTMSQTRACLPECSLNEDNRPSEGDTPVCQLFSSSANPCRHSCPGGDPSCMASDHLQGHLHCPQLIVPRCSQLLPGLPCCKWHKTLQTQALSPGPCMCHLRGG